MRISLLEDNEHQSTYMKKLLEDAGYEVRVFDDGSDLIRSIDRDTADAYVLDWEVPRKSGFQVLQYLRDVRRQKEPVVFVTAKTDESHIASALNAGADDYCLKPIRKEEFLARVNAVLRRTYQPMETGIGRNLHGYMFHETEGSVTYAGIKKNLATKEFKLAVCFFENLDRILSRDRLIAEVWGHQTEDFSRSLDVHISWLRRKLDLGAAGTSYRIKSIYGFGYRLMPVARDMDDH
jgi:two-component system response regulator RegX3